MDRYPRYSKLTSYERSLVNNGCGPEWFPEWVRKVSFGWMFHAQCGHHDWGYLVGGNEKRRLECDLKFGKAMLKDVVMNYYFALIQTIMAPIFFGLVLFFGWTCFHYGTPRTQQEALEAARKKRGK